MSDDNKKVKIDVSSGEGSFIFCCFATFWLTIGDHDIIDAIIHYLMK